MALRHHLPELHRPFRLSGAYLLSVLGMFAATLVFLWSGWAIVSKAGIALIIALVMLGIYRILGKIDLKKYIGILENQYGSGFISF